MNKKVKVILVSLIAIVLLSGTGAVIYLKSAENNKDKVQRAVVNKYMAGYQKPNLAAVREVVSDEMKFRLPDDQKKFKQQVEKTNETNGKIHQWVIKSSDTNEYVGQCIAEVSVVTSKKTYEVLFDIVGDDKNGWKIRAVKENKDAQDSTANMGGMGQQAPGQHGMQ